MYTIIMGNSIVDELVAKTMRELAEPTKPTPRSRISNTPNGYIHLVAWANASLLRVFVHRFSDPLPKSHHRLKAQLDDAARSTVANIEEGYSRPTTSSYLDFLGYSYASLQEVKGDIQRSRQDNLLLSTPGSTIESLGIDLKIWHEALKKTVISHKGVYRNLEEFKHVYTAVADSSSSTPPLNSFKFLYDPIDSLQARDITYEIFIELINKTDWHLRRLVVSLEDKLNRDQKFYQVEKARIRSNTQFRR